MAQKIKLNFEIDGLKDANKQLEKLESTAEDLKKQLDGVEEGSDAFNKINKECRNYAHHISLTSNFFFFSGDPAPA